MAHTLENGHVRAESGDQRLRVGRSDRGEQRLGFGIGGQQVAALHRDAVDVTAQSRADRGPHPGDVLGATGAGVDHRDASLAGRRPGRISVDGDTGRVAAAVSHLAQHPGEQLPELGVELGGAQVQTHDPAHSFVPSFPAQNAVR